MIVLMLINLPIIVWMLYTYFREIPGEILEAARMDGATLRSEILYVLTPMAIPGHGLDRAAERHSGMERGVLDVESDCGKSCAADRIHRQLFKPRGPVLTPNSARHRQWLSRRS